MIALSIWYRADTPKGRQEHVSEAIGKAAQRRLEKYLQQSYDNEQYRSQRPTKIFISDIYFSASVYKMLGFTYFFEIWIFIAYNI